MQFTFLALAPIFPAGQESLTILPWSIPIRHIGHTYLDIVLTFSLPIRIRNRDKMSVIWKLGEKHPSAWYKAEDSLCL